MSWDYNDVTGEPMWTEAGDGPVPYDALQPPQEEINFTPEESAAASTIPEPQLQEVGMGESASQTAFNPNTFQSLETKGRTGIDKQNAKAFNAATDQANELATGFNNAAAQTKSATEELGNLEANKTAASAQFTGELASRQAQLATESQAEYEIAMQKTRQYASDYEVQLKQLASMGVNPGRLYSNMTVGQKGTALVSAFVTDFLGTKGIKTSAMDIINRGIDQDIDAQVNAINNKRAVADGFARLWSMQREQSTSDYEAKIRMKGMMLESFKTEVAGKLGQFDSDIARAKIPLALAQVDENLAKVKVDLIKFRNDQFNQDANRNVQIRGQNVQASIASASRAHDLKIRQMDNDAKAKAAIAEQKKLTAVRVPENKQVGTLDGKTTTFIGPDGKEHTVVTQITPGVKNERVGRVAGFAADAPRAKELQGKVDATQRALGLVEEVRTLQKDQGGNWTYLGSKITEDKAKSLLISKYNDLLSDVIFAKSGKAATDAERNVLKGIIPENTFVRGILQSGNGGDISSEVIAAWGLKEIQGANDAAVTNLTQPSAQDMVDYEGGISGELFPGNKTTNETFNRAPEKTEVDDLIGTVNSAKTRSGGKGVSTKGNEDVYDTAADYFSSIGKLETIGDKTVLGGEYLDQYKQNGKTREYLVPDLRDNVPEWFDAMDRLKDRAISVDTTPEEYAKIVEYLSEKAADDPNFFNVPEEKDKQGAALYFLNEITNHGRLHGQN